MTEHSVHSDTWPVRAFDYRKWKAKNDANIPLQSGSFSVHLSVDKSPSGALISATLKLTKTATGGCSVDNVTLDLALYATLPKINNIPPLRFHHKDEVVLVCHRDLGDEAGAQSYCRLLLFLNTTRDARSLVAQLCAVNMDACPASDQGASELFNVEHSAYMRSGTSKDHGASSAPSQINGLDVHSQPRLPHADPMVPTSLIDQSKPWLKKTAPPVALLNTTAAESAFFGGTQRPATTSNEAAPQGRTHVRDTSIYDLTTPELRAVIARVVREDGFADFVDTMKAVCFPRNS